MLVLALYHSHDRGSAWLWTGLALYGVAKVFEMSDGPIYHALGIVSGHTLKHLTAAAAVGCVVAMLRERSESLSDDLDLVFSEQSSCPRILTSRCS